MLEIIDYIDKKLEVYKKRYLKMKQKALREIERKKEEIGKRTFGRDSDEEQDRNKDKKRKKKRKDSSSSEEEVQKQKKNKKKVKQNNNVDLLELGD